MCFDIATMKRSHLDYLFLYFYDYFRFPRLHSDGQGCFNIFSFFLFVSLDPHVESIRTGSMYKPRQTSGQDFWLRQQCCSLPS